VRSEQIAAHLLAYGRVVPIEEIKEKLDAVTVGAVRGVGERLMSTPRPAIAALGPIDSLESYESFTGRFSPAAHAAE
jgi:processing peptidase subunit beta